MISWKYSFEEISKDLDLAKKKKQALEDLFNAAKISESTYQSLNSDISNTISEIEKRQKALAEKMTSKLTVLEQQINTLEVFLANSEIQHVAGEIDDELHERESNAFSLGLDALRQQLDGIKGIASDIMPEITEPTPSSEPGETVEAEAPPTEETAEMPVETPVEEAPVEVAEETEAVSEEVPVEEPTETPIEEAPVQESVETPPEMPTEEPEEQIVSPEEAVEEPEATQEPAVEGEVEETSPEEEMETPTEEVSSDDVEEEPTEEETEW